MTLSSKSSRVDAPQLPRIRMLPAVWTVCCVLAVIGLSFVLFKSQQQRNLQLTSALDTQVSQLRSHANVH